MKTSSRRSQLLALLAAVLLGWVLYAYRALDQAQQAAAASGQDLVGCQALANRIAALQHRPALAGSKELQVTELTQRLVQAARSAGMAPENMVRISPEPAARVGESVYKEKPTQVLLRNVRLQEIIRFFYALSEQDAGLTLKSLRLASPHEQENTDRWTVEATLTYLIYAPRSDGGGPGSAGHRAEGAAGIEGF